MTKKLQPKLRFREFTDDWEQRKLGSLGTSYSGLSGKDKTDFGHGYGSYITYLNVFQNPIADIDGTDRIEIDTKQNTVRYGDVLFTVSSETPEEVGMSSVWLGNQQNVYLNSFCFGYRQNGAFDAKYLAYMLRSKSIRNRMKVLAQGISRFNISQRRVMDIEVSFPSMDEQQKIGTLCRKLDQLIAAEKRKLNLLKDKKTAFLQQIFDQKIRFKGFADPWKQQKLGELISNGGSGGTPSSKVKDYYIGNIPFLNISDITMRNIQDSEKHISKRGLESCHAWIVPAGSISLTMYASVGKVGILMQPMATSQAFYNLCFSDDSLRDFIYSRLEKAQIFSEWNPYIATGTQGNLNANAVRSFKIDVPEFEEIRLISILFTVFDTLVSAEKQKIDLLNLKKKALLRQMFV